MRVSLGPILAIAVLAGFTVASEAVGADRSVPQPYPTIQSAILAAADGDTVLVAPGTYVENLDFLGKAITVRSTDGPEVTVIDGGQAGSVVRFQSGESTASILEGFTIRNGSGELREGLRQGGGVLCEASSPIIRGNVIESNFADYGGGVSCRISSGPVLVGNEIVENEAIPVYGRGGGVYIELDSFPALLENRIEANVASAFGGGICIVESTAVIDSNDISGNVVNDPMGGAAGIHCYVTPDLLITNNRIAGNSAPSVGGVGIYATEGPVLVKSNRILDNTASGGGVAIVQSTSVSVEGNLIARNISSDTGGGVVLSEAGGRLSGNLIIANHAAWLGGGVVCAPGTTVIENNVIFGNESEAFNYRSAAGIWIAGPPCPLLVNNTIVGNYSTGYSIGGEGIYCAGYQNDPVILNTIVWGNPGPAQILVERFANPTVSYCLVEGGWAGTGTNNLDADPRFVDAENGDLHLRFGSPCVDRGDNAAASLPETDMEGDPRVVNGDKFPEAVVDIGADELVPEIAARFGTVNASEASLANVLLVNGSAGNRRRVVTVSVLDPVEASLVAPPAGPTPAAFALYAWAGEPDLSTLTVQPHDLGVTGFPTPLQGSPPHPGVIWNNLGHFGRLGVASHPSSPAPSILFSKKAWVPATVTLQGFIQDGGSAADGPVSVTNAVVVKIVE